MDVQDVVQFTSENQSILHHCGLSDKTLIKTDGDVRRKISWVQVRPYPSAYLGTNMAPRRSRRVSGELMQLGNTEDYTECKYIIEGQPESVVMVFVAEVCGTPPASFKASGHAQGDGRLHFGFVFKDNEKSKAVYFVIHPNSWDPFQHRFKTTEMTRMLDEAVEKGTEMASGKIFLGSVFPGIGTAAVDTEAGWIANKIIRFHVGQYLRYIG